MAKLFITLVVYAMILGCTNNEDSDADKNSDPTSLVLDLNSDGIEDIKYEFEDDFYYELVDRNFDGRVDESHEYNYSDKLVSSRIDSDFDGILESSITYYNGSIRKLISDTSGDGLYDLYFEYEAGNLIYSERYYTATDSEGARIGMYRYDFGYPSSPEEFEPASMTPETYSKHLEGR